MDSSPTEALRISRRAVRGLANAELAPNVMEWDEAQRFPFNHALKFTVFGLFGTQFPERYGSYGFVKGSAVKNFFRDVKLTTIGEGSSEIQQMVITRQYLD